MYYVVCVDDKNNRSVVSYVDYYTAVDDFGLACDTVKWKCVFLYYGSIDDLSVIVDRGTYA